MGYVFIVGTSSSWMFRKIQVSPLICPPRLKKVRNFPLTHLLYPVGCGKSPLRCVQMHSGNLAGRCWHSLIQASEEIIFMGLFCGLMITRRP